MQKKQITIHKRNELVRGADLYSLNGKRCMNAIYYIYQKHRDIFLPYEQKGITYISLKFSTLRDLMGLEKDNNYVEIIKSAINELQTTLLELNNWTNPVTKKKYLWYSTKFLNDANVETDNNIYVQLEISTLFKQLINSQINFTKLNLIQHLNKFRTKHAMKIYEYLKSFEGFHYLDVSQKHMLKLLGLEEDDRTYKNYSALKRLIERQIKEITKKSDLTEIKLYEDKAKLLSKQKIFRIIIDPKSKRKADTTQSKKKLDQMTDNLFTRF